MVIIIIWKLLIGEEIFNGLSDTSDDFDVEGFAIFDDITSDD